MKLIQIGNRIVNLDQITSVEYLAEDVHPSNPPRVYSSLTVNYSSDSFNYNVFYEAEADELWQVLRQNTALKLDLPTKQAKESTDIDPVPLDIEETFTSSIE
ncbi:MAG: hypothetical protein ACPL4I_11165 [Bacteroidota bacterium]